MPPRKRGRSCGEATAIAAAHKDESDDAAQHVRIVSFPQNSFKRAQSLETHLDADNAEGVKFYPR